MGVPDDYARVLEMASGTPGKECQLEALELQATHPDVGAYLVGLWGLPNTIAEAIAFHEDPAYSLGPFSLPASCTSPTASRIIRTSPIRAIRICT